MTLTGRRWELVSRPVGPLGPEHIRLAERLAPEPEPGQVLVRNLYLSIDPAVRRRLDDQESYIAPIPLGGAPTSAVIGQVVRSRSEALAEGDLVSGFGAWEEYSLLAAEGATVRLDPATAPQRLPEHLGVLGLTGLTAYFGLTDIGRPARGETVLVSAAAGGVGSTVGQIAKALGCRAVGVVGDADKAAWITGELGFDAGVIHRGKDAQALAQEIGRAAPDGVDVQFENVGGALLDAGLLNLNTGGRVVLCGLIAQYNSPDEPAACRQLWRLIMRGATMKGLLVKDYLPRRAEAVAQLTAWMEQGRLRSTLQVEVGLERAVEAFARLFDGRSRGKLVLKLGDPQ